MNIYDEAIELEKEIKENRLQLTKEKYRDLEDIKFNKIIKSKSDKHDRVIKALERAKKVEELLNFLLQKVFKENYYTDVKLLEQQKTIDYIRKIHEEIILEEKEFEVLKNA